MKSRGVDFKFGGGKLELHANTAQVGESEASMIVAYDGPGITITLDPRFMVNFLKVLPLDRTIIFRSDERQRPRGVEHDDG